LAPRQSVDVIDVADASAAVADRGALARAKMQTLGCAKKDRKVQMRQGSAFQKHMFFGCLEGRIR
jgi:hypothetical protein